jgi:hypothetical protein
MQIECDGGRISSVVSAWAMNEDHTAGEQLSDERVAELAVGEPVILAIHPTSTMPYNASMVVVMSDNSRVHILADLQPRPHGLLYEGDRVQDPNGRQGIATRNSSLTEPGTVRWDDGKWGGCDWTALRYAGPVGQ